MGKESGGPCWGPWMPRAGWIGSKPTWMPPSLRLKGGERSMPDPHGQRHQVDAGGGQSWDAHRRAGGQCPAGGGQAGGTHSGHGEGSQSQRPAPQQSQGNWWQTGDTIPSLSGTGCADGESSPASQNGGANGPGRAGRRMSLTTVSDGRWNGPSLGCTTTAG